MLVSCPPSSIMSLSLMLRTSSGSHLLSSSPSSSSELITIVATQCFFHLGCPLLSLFGGKSVGGRGGGGEIWHHCCSYVFCGTLKYRHSLSADASFVLASRLAVTTAGLELIQRIEKLSSVRLRLCPSASPQRVEKALQKRLTCSFLELHGTSVKER